MNSASALADHQGLEEELNRICKLPDELLSKILSCLSFNEAVRSSVLSIKKFSPRSESSELYLLTGHAHCLTMTISTDGWSSQFRRESSLSSYPSCFSTTSSRKIVTVTSKLRLDCQISDPSDVYVWVV